MKQPSRKFRIERRKLDSRLNRQKAMLYGKVCVEGSDVAYNTLNGFSERPIGFLAADVIRTLHFNPRELWS